MESANTALIAKTGADDDELPLAVQTELQVELVETRERLGIPDPATSVAINERVAELEHLKEAIREQEQAKLEAFEAAAELQQQLAAAQAAVAKSKTQYHGAPKSRGSAFTRAETELAEVNTQLHAVKMALDWEQRSHRADAVQATSKIRRLERELAEAIAANEMRSKGRHVPLRVVAGVAVALALAAGIGAFVMHGQSSVASSRQLQADPPQQEAGAVVTRHSAPSAVPDFTQSVDRLSQALAALSGRDPEEVLRQVQKAGRGCALRWNAGEPSLLFGGPGAKSPAFGDVMNQCAEAVEKLR